MKIKSNTTFPNALQNKDKHYKDMLQTSTLKIQLKRFNVESLILPKCFVCLSSMCCNLEEIYNT